MHMTLVLSASSFQKFEFINDRVRWGCAGLHFIHESTTSFDALQGLLRARQTMYATAMAKPTAASSYRTAQGIVLVWK